MGGAAVPIPQGGLEVVSIAKSYDKRAVLTDISLSVGKGEVLGLLGPNGAGKTTCFYSIMGLVRPDSGRILLDGVDITKLPMYRRSVLGLGYLPQETSIFRGMTVEQNIATVLELVEPDKATRAAELDRLLDEFGLTRLRASPAMALSGGERRRCEIARAWPRARRSSCSTNPSPGSTRCRSATSATWSKTSRSAASAC
jgi:lipopolysaccharide export system ATP-binding protein